jgi:hypothetical protein
LGVSPAKLVVIFDFHFDSRYSEGDHRETPVGLHRRAFFFSLELEMTDAEILTLVDRLERCLLAKDEFHHRDHLAVAAAYLYAGDFDSALERMRASLTRFAAHHGVSGLYHETLTRFWLLQVEQRLDRQKCLSVAVRKIQQELADKQLPFTFYSKDLIGSPEARRRWTEPDLRTLEPSGTCPGATRNRVTSAVPLESKKNR